MMGRGWCALAAAIVLGGSAALAPPLRAGARQEPPTFASGVESVYVDVFVTRDGRPLPGLRAQSFELEDNGERQVAEVVAVDSLPLTTLLVFDTSGSVEGGKLRALRTASEAFLAGLRRDDEIGLIGFSHEVRFLARPSADRQSLRRGLEAMQATGGTALWDALYAALTVLETRARIVVVLFTDGEDNMSFLGPRQVKTVAERSNALVQVVGFKAPRVLGRLGHVVEPPEPEHLRLLRETAEATGGRFWDAGSPDRLGTAFAAIMAAMNTRYVLRYEPLGPSRAGWHRIELRLRGQKGDVHARRGYWRAPSP